MLDKDDEDMMANP